MTRTMHGATATSKRSAIGVAQVVVAASSWGLWSLFLRPTGLSGVVTTPIVFGIVAIVCFVLIPLDRVQPVWHRRVVVWLVVFSVLDAVNMATFFEAMNQTSVAIAVLTHYLAPVLVALAAPRVDGERVPGALLAATVATIGLALVLEPWRSAAPGALLGGTLGTVSAVAYATNVFIARYLVGQIGAARAMSYHAALASVLVIPLAGTAALAAVPAESWLLLAGGGATAGALAGWIYLRGLRTIGSSRAAVLAFLEPLVAVIVGLTVWNEPLSATAWLGGLLILGSGIAVVSRHGLPVSSRRSGTGDQLL